MPKATYYRHSVELPNGEIRTRRSMHQYEFAVICNEDAAKRAAFLLDPKWDDGSRKDYRYFMKVANGFPCGINWSSEYSQLRAQEEARARIGDRDEEEYVKWQRFERTKAIPSPEDAANDWGVYAWCSRRDLAEKQASKCRKGHSVGEVRIVQVCRVAEVKRS